MDRRCITADGSDSYLLEGKLADNSQKVEMLNQSLADVEAIGNAAETYKLQGQAQVMVLTELLKELMGLLKLKVVIQVFIFTKSDT